MGNFKIIKPKEIIGNPIKLIGSDWMLITAGNKKSFNTMTAAWGGLGFLWKKPVAFIFVRPQRYTFQFTEKYNYFTLSFFDKQYKDILNFCGVKSGREVDKVKETGLTIAETEIGNIYFSEAYQVIECKKIYHEYLKEENFVNTDVPSKIYPSKDYHRVYIGEIINCMIANNIKTR